jgi:hypothetical protein
VAIKVLDAHLLKPAGLHDAGDADRVVAVTLIDLHLEYRPGMASVDTDHRKAKLLELGPQPCGSRPCLKADPYRSWRFRSHECSDRLRLGSTHSTSSGLLAASAVSSVNRNMLDPQAWLADVLARIADHKISDLAALLPWNWRHAIPVARAA